jgi:hypothetical protein
MTNYNILATEPKQFLALTGYTVEEFAALLPTFSTCFLTQMQRSTLAGKLRQRPYVSYRELPVAHCGRQTAVYSDVSAEGDHAGYLW